MKNALIIHGMPDREEYYNPNLPSLSNMHWLPWLQKQLLQKDILTQTPELPEPYEPVYAKWLEVFKQFDINEQTLLIGHSCGGGFITRFLSENNIKVGKAALVAPWIDPKHTLKTGFFDFELDKGIVSKTDGLTIFYSTDDSSDIIQTVNTLQEVGIELKEFNDKGHFTFQDMKTDAFPELRDFLLL